MRVDHATPHRILVALNLAEDRDPAFERALGLAKSSGAQLYLLHAVPADYPFSFRAAERLRRTEELRRRAEAAGVRTVVAEQTGDPAEIIVLHADARSVDFIVMGTERRTGWALFRRPSVAEHVLRRTKRPTLVVAAHDLVDGEGFKNIVVGVDLSPASTRLIDKAINLLGRRPRHVTAIHAVDSVGPRGAFGHRMGWLVPEYRGHVLGQARRRLKALMPQSPDTEVKLRARVAAGAVADTIRTHADDVNADLIVLGRSSRFMHLGSTAVAILRHTDRTLLVIPPTAEAEMVGADQVIHTRAA